MTPTGTRHNLTPTMSYIPAPAPVGKRMLNASTGLGRHVFISGPSFLFPSVKRVKLNLPLPHFRRRL
jgi:hypothetical protein